MLRATLREFYPGALAAFPELAVGDALAILIVTPTRRTAERCRNLGLPPRCAELADTNSRKIG